ncbi:MAG: threonine ammonia-lyase [Sulfolobales archaeon]|nr:threonine ammonia-lyase [Sulfolobales archaeon]MCX8208107.1 threonine ammonia-lyase [Sulfolobales archaeon]MDW8010589.1 threonine ammonia-lyase [Sulfolobales archaeon]
MNEADRIWGLIKRANDVIEEVVHRTPLIHSTFFSKMSGNNIFLKLENLQKTGAFKVRGAYFKMYSELDSCRKFGVVAASSGNHAQGVAYSASELGIAATIVMPETAPPYKISATRSYGAKVVLYGRVYDESYEKAIEISRETNAIFIHPFDDPHVIAGQGTIGVEIATNLKNVDYVLVPVGGGGLISGIAIAIKKILGSGVKVVAVEPKNAPKLYQARTYGRPQQVPVTPSLADGVVTKSVGELTYRLMSEYVDDVVLVDEDSIARAMFLLMERAKLVAEGAGALPLAAVLSGYLAGRGRNVVVVVSGGNADLTTIYRVILKGLSVENRVAKLSLFLEDVPGSLYRVLEVLAKHRCNVLEVRHERIGLEIPSGYALVEIVFEQPDGEIPRAILEKIVNQISKDIRVITK